MKFHTNLVLCIVALEITKCTCQFGGELMGGELFGGMGGLGGLALMSGLGAMGGQGSTSGFGGARGSASAAASESLVRAVHFIVGPTASPDQQILDFAVSQGREPTSMLDMMRYIPHMQRIARATYGQFLNAMASQNSANSPKTEPNAATNSASAGQGKTLDQLLADLDAMVFQRAIEWHQRTGSPRGGNSATGIGDMSLMVPAMMLM